jgi:hypothetical protein
LKLHILVYLPLSGTVSFIESHSTIGGLSSPAWAGNWPVLRLSADHSYNHSDPAIQFVYFLLNAKYGFKEETSETRTDSDEQLSEETDSDS